MKISECHVQRRGAIYVVVDDDGKVMSGPHKSRDDAADASTFRLNRAPAHTAKEIRRAQAAKHNAESLVNSLIEGDGQPGFDVPPDDGAAAGPAFNNTDGFEDDEEAREVGIANEILDLVDSLEHSQEDPSTALANIRQLADELIEMHGGVMDDDEERRQTEYGYDRLAGGAINPTRESKLTTAQRNSLPKGSFALPGRRYPVDTKARARNALSRVSQNGSSAEKAKVRAKVHRKFPDVGKQD